MIRKAIYATVGLVALAAVFTATDLGSYVCTSFGRVKESVKGSVPIDFEIERARKMVKDLVPEIRTAMHVIAKEEVEVARLEKQIVESDTRLQKDRAELIRLKTDLSTGEANFVYAGNTYTVGQVRNDLAHRFERYKTKDATLGSLREIHSARQRSLEAARQKLEGMLVAKRQLEVDVENLEARLKMVEASQTTSPHSFDDSRLSRVKELITDLRTRLDVAEKLIDSDTALQDEIPLEEEAPADIVDQVTEYFEGEKSAESPQVAKATD